MDVRLFLPRSSIRNSYWVINWYIKMDLEMIHALNYTFLISSVSKIQIIDRLFHKLPIKQKVGYLVAKCKTAESQRNYKMKLHLKSKYCLLLSTVNLGFFNFTVSYSKFFPLIHSNYYLCTHIIYYKIW